MNLLTFDKEHTMEKLHCALQQRFANFEDVVMHEMRAFDNQTDILLSDLVSDVGQVVG